MGRSRGKSLGGHTFVAFGSIFGCTTEPLGRFWCPGSVRGIVLTHSFAPEQHGLPNDWFGDTCLTECQPQPPCEWAGVDEMFGKVLFYGGKAAQKVASRARPETCWEERK